MSGERLLTDQYVVIHIRYFNRTVLIIIPNTNDAPAIAPQVTVLYWFLRDLIRIIINNHRLPTQIPCE